MTTSFMESDASVMSDMKSSWALNVLQQERCLVSQTYNQVIHRNVGNSKLKPTLDTINFKHALLGRHSYIYAHCEAGRTVKW